MNINWKIKKTPKNLINNKIKECTTRRSLNKQIQERKGTLKKEESILECKNYTQFDSDRPDDRKRVKYLWSENLEVLF